MKRKPIPKAIRAEVLAKYDGHCGYCGCKPEKLQIDHVIPHARGHQYAKKGIDLDAIENLMPVCAKCNNYKISYSLEEFRQMIGRSIELCRKNSVNFRNCERFGMVLVVNDTNIVFHFEEVANDKKSTN